MGEIKRLPDCEELVMSIVWRADEAPDLAAVRESVNARYGKEWKPQTVSTILCRLVKKGFLSMYRKGRYCYYKPLVSKREFWKATVNEDVRMFSNGDAEDFVCCLCDEMLSKEDITKLKMRLDELS